MKKFQDFFILLVLLGIFIIGGCNSATTPPTLTPTPTLTANTGTVYGKVEEEISNEVISSVTIEVDTKGGTYQTDQNGLYRIEGLTPGEHSLIFKKIGYRTKEIKVKIEQGKEIEKDVKLENTQIVIRESITLDTYITSDYPNTNFGEDFSLQLGKNYRILIQLPDLSHVLTGYDNIISAKLYLHKKSVSGSGKFLVYDVYPTIEYWKEDEATWIERVANVDWFSEGSTHFISKVAHGIFNSVINEWVEIDMMDAFNYWFNSSFPLFQSLTFITDTPDIFIDFYSSEFGTNYASYIEMKIYIP